MMCNTKIEFYLRGKIFHYLTLISFRSFQLYAEIQEKYSYAEL